jgi:UDP-2-acetamido-3-amino-2,3-dideoxy-glucuronate N-acetyltransferase
MSNDPGSSAVRQQTRVRGVTVLRLPSFVDHRGKLACGEAWKEIPFAVERFFLVYGVPGKEVRGEHAHRQLHQLFICVHGQCKVTADDGEVRQEFLLTEPTLGLHIEPLVWCAQHEYTSDAVLLVLASDLYDAADYIREYAEFQKVLTATR